MYIFSYTEIWLYFGLGCKDCALINDCDLLSICTKHRGDTKLKEKLWFTTDFIAFFFPHVRVLTYTSLKKNDMGCKGFFLYIFRRQRFSVIKKKKIHIKQPPTRLVKLDKHAAWYPWSPSFSVCVFW